MTGRETINRFLVDIFNNLLRQEQQALAASGYHNLSVSEFHVIEAVVKGGENNTMGSLSKALGITLGSLTVAVKTLERKGYLHRERHPDDRRVVQAVPTPLGLEANEYHAHFHRQMVEAITQNLKDEEARVLSQALERVEAFFENQSDRETRPQ